MNTALYIVLGIVVGVILTPLLLWIAFKLFVYFFFKKLIKALGQMGGSVPPMRLEVEPAEEDHEWIDAKLIERLTKELEKSGFQPTGDYLLLSQTPVNARGFANPESNLYALLYDWDRDLMPGLGVVVDVVARSADADKATDYTVTNSPETWLDKPPWTEKRHLDIDVSNARLAVETLLERLQEMTAGEALTPTPADGFVAALKSAYAREMDWQIDRGGLQEEEIRRNCIKMQGVEEDNEQVLSEAVESLQRAWSYAIDEFVSEETRTRFLKHVTKMSAGEWEDVRDRVYVVHEKSVADRLKEELTDALMPDDPGDLTDDELDASIEQRLRPHFTDHTPREAFESAQALLPEDRRYKRLARIKSPWPADVYLEPEDPEYD